ncbi:hypothetical protein RFI_38431 [Reticulomyxa filosa]|uniref:Uncharacterized protein n=1 Tax=Reticulomyxa filosa TaxID=46433 RepID=X6LE83_RETFI|nr:hypothetical protein RFI_38431 [Reticulomyxa filosa]|eukprot:ETN99054.1 hypothetical protein RFI_38431 [Reticulomyxa filosa]
MQQKKKKRLMKSHSTTISEYEYANDHRHSNQVQSSNIEQKENQDGKHIVIQDVTFIERHSREEAVTNPEVNKYVLLRGVSTRESDDEIKETLEDYGYQIQEVKRFHKMPIVKVLLSKKGKSRPKSHFKQCRKCYILNRECPRKRKVCKYCGLANHEVAKCRHKNNPSKHKCVLCRKQHPSDSLIRKAREKLGYEQGPERNEKAPKGSDFNKFLFVQ